LETFFTHRLPGRKVETTNGKAYLWFSGTDYLGMGHDPYFQGYVNEGLNLLGTHFGSSRNNSLRLSIYEDTEAAFSEFAGAESALIVSSGMWAGQLVMKEIEKLVSATTGHTPIQYHYAPRVHPALWGNSFKTNPESWADWASDTIRTINQQPENTIHIICSDAVGSPVPELFDFLLFKQINNPGRVYLVIDESHSLGVLGPGGKGVYKTLKDSLQLKIVALSSLNKAFGIPAGAVYGISELIGPLHGSPWFAGASPSAPAYIFALKKLLDTDHYAHAHRILQDNIGHLTAQITDSKLFTMFPHYPVFCSTGPALFEYLLENGIMASCFPYPKPTDTPTTRLAISSVHKTNDLDRLAEVMKRFQN
jgi:8-amino-7-oxononanoate synthase